jgi:cysteine synthase A
MIKQKLESIGHLIGHTPLRELIIKNKGINLYIKLEYFNFTGSIKDRAAYHILKHAIEGKQLNDSSSVVESSSGNFAIALASICKILGLNFTAVIDPNINLAYEKVLKQLAYEVIKVTNVDRTNGYLITRIETVKEIIKKKKMHIGRINMRIKITT